MNLAMDRYRLEKYGYVEWSDDLKKLLRNAEKLGNLTAEDEDFLSSKVKEGRWAEENLTECDNRKERRALENFEQMGKRAQEVLAIYNFGLCAKVARAYKGKVDYEELVGAGIVGLCRASKSFDSKFHEVNPATGEIKEGVRFSTYAKKFIEGECKKRLWLANAFSSPQKVEDKRLAMRKKESGLFVALGKTPSAEELAKALGCSVEDVALWERLGSKPVSIEASRDHGDAPSLYETIPDIEEEEEPIEKGNELSVHVGSILRDAGLTDRERQALTLLYSTPKHPSYKEIGEEMHVSKQRVGQYINSARRKLGALV